MKLAWKMFSFINIQQIAPAYEGVELGGGEGVLLKTLAHATGKNEKLLREKLQKMQDLGVLAKGLSPQCPHVSPTSLTTVMLWHV
jgi:DNA ligase-1